MNKEILNLVEKVFIFLKLEDFSKLKNILTTIEKDYPNYYKIFENFKAEKEEKEKELILQKSLLKNEIREILKNYSESSEEKSFLEFLLEKI